MFQKLREITLSKYLNQLFRVYFIIQIINALSRISNLIYIQLSVPPFYKLMFDIFMLIFLRKIFIHHFLPSLVGLREMLNDMSYLRPFFICARECCFARKDSQPYFRSAKYVCKNFLKITFSYSFSPLTVEAGFFRYQKKDEFLFENSKFAMGQDYLDDRG